MYSKAVESIEQFGMVDPVLVRDMPKGKPPYQIIDGAHRARACVDLGTLIPAHSVGVVSDSTAKKLTISLNEIHGVAKTADMGRLLDDLLQTMSIEDLAIGLPMSPETIETYVQAAEIAFPDIDMPTQVEPKASDPSKERWVERTYRVPSSVAELLDQAIDKARSYEAGTGREITDAQAIEIIAAEYMAG